MRKIPIGVEDFKRIISENYYYADKTKFIENIINDGAIVKLFTRPRRFGKTLNMSMLKYFFDVENKEENRKLFNDLYIENSPVIEEQGKYPVIFISMKEIQASNFESCVETTKILLENLFKNFRFLLKELDELDKPTFMKYATQQISTEEAKKGLKVLSDLLSNYYNEKVVVLIDEYDSPLIAAYEHNYYDEAVLFFKGLYGNVLKTNSNLKMGVMTGIVRVAQAGIFSDLNNLIVYTILREQYSEYFGLTENEVTNALDYYNLEYNIEKVKEWYDGYKFGQTEVYNPWSILNYISAKELEAYWVNTSSNVVIREMLKNSGSNVFKILENLFDKKDVSVTISNSIALGGNLASSEVWELLLFSGYLTVKKKISEDEYLVRIPNQEILSFFKKTFLTILFGELSLANNTKDALLNKDIDRIKEIIEKLVLNAMSIFDTDKRYENNYQLLLSGFFYALDGVYLVYPNTESGYGRPDIILEALDKTKPSYILELKKADEKNIERQSEKAVEQIENKKYDAVLERKGIKDIVKIGIAFNGKRAEFEY